MKIIYDIQWDTDGDENIAADLPNYMIVPEGMSDKEEISDWISNETGFCHQGFKLIDACQPKRLELLGQLIDVFEDFLEEKRIDILNPEKEEDDSDNLAILYGSDYDVLSDQIESILRLWKDEIPKIL